MSLFLSILTIMIAIGATALWAAYRADKHDKERWNDGVCECSTGWFIYDGSPFWEVFRYRCTSCGHEIITGKRMDR